MIMLESLKQFANAQPQAEKITDAYTLDEVSFKRLFRQIFTIADRYKDVPRTTGDDYDLKYWEEAVKDIGTLSNEWKLHDAEGKEITDAEGCCKFHPLFFNMAMAVLDSYEEIYKARRS